MNLTRMVMGRVSFSFNFYLANDLSNKIIGSYHLPREAENNVGGIPTT